MIFAFGASIGSFLNVVAYRVPAGRSIVRPGSACPSCGAAIRWFDNLPVLSWFILRGRCRSCDAPFSWRYCAVEAFFGAFTVAAALRWGLSVHFLSAVTVSAVLVVIALIDHDTWLIDDRMSAAAALLGLAGHVLTLRIDAALPWDVALLSGAGHLGAGLIAFAVLWGLGATLTRVLKKEALGGGDAPLLGAIVCGTGFAGFLPVLMLASLQGLLAWALLSRFGGVGDRSVTHDDGWQPEDGALPMGIFLALAGLEVHLTGEGLMDAYLSLIRSLIP
jgi:leader peptidase (prepilin peptidase)/N-methyltransferase